MPVKRPVVCAADIAPFVIGGNTGDGVVNVDDLLAVINAWGICPIDPNPCPPDIAPIPTGNNLVNVEFDKFENIKDPVKAAMKK